MYQEYIKKLESNNLLNKIWKYVIDLIVLEEHDEEFLLFICIIFSFFDDGDVCVLLDSEDFLKKFLLKIQGNEISDKLKIDENIITNVINNIKDGKYQKIINENSFLCIYKNHLFLNKYYYARNDIALAFDRIFVDTETNNINTNILDYLNPNFSLSFKQIEVINKGLNKNLIVSGGPGTGKTTSILFILIALLQMDKYINSDVYLVAFSGKAASRMKESIISGFDLLKDDFRSNNPILEKIEILESSTIHSLLKIKNDSTFSMNEENQFKENSIFVIDEASMIDMCLFASLLKTIPCNCKVFIMGDKNQLPSINSGAIFQSLLNHLKLKDYIVELDESKRFKKGSTIYNLASLINNGNDLKLSNSDFNSYQNFEIMSRINDDFPVYYYDVINHDTKKELMVSEIINKIISKFIDMQYEICTNINANDFKEIFKHYFSYKLLACENNGVFGVNYLNNIVEDKIRRKYQIDDKYYNGQSIIVLQNNKELDLYNGDNGIIVSIAGKEDKYLAFNKQCNVVCDNENIICYDGVTCFNEKILYKLELDNSYAISVHKSQGSDYSDIFIFLPDNLKSPLLNRQILYTAITRTKGSVYLFSSLKHLNVAKDNLLERVCIL